MRLIAGLGNVGGQYARTRHNVGWLVLDELGRRHAASWRAEGQSQVADLRLSGPGGLQRVLLCKPQTMMNSSGRAVQPLLSYYKLTPDDLLVVQDDLDSPFGLMRLRHGGRHGGQNGVRDIIRLLGTEAFDRLKLGISRPPPGRDPADWVLSRWAEEEGPTLERLVGLAADAAELWATAGRAEVQGRFNSTDLRPAPPPEPAAPSAAGDPATGEPTARGAGTVGE